MMSSRSSSKDSDGSSTSPDSNTPQDSRNEIPPPPRKPIPRKGHTKSRRGCYSCKRRRIKCNEKHPRCSHCIKAGLECEYPANIIQTTQRSSPGSPSPQEVVNLRSTPGTFTMLDLRLFHHFLVTAYPHLPVGADKLWINVIPSFAHNALLSICYEYLIHSILALAASHLAAVSNASVTKEAISHRILAVQALNEALSVPPKTRLECDARMAAAMALAFQSSHLQDGLLEFLTMVRGCNLIAMEEEPFFGRHQQESAFSAFREDNHLATMQARVNESGVNTISHEDLDQARASLRIVQTLNMTEWERRFFDILVRTVENAYERPVETYTTFVMLYNQPSRMSHDEFQSFVDPGNDVAQILLAHFIGVQFLLTPILMLERVGFQGINAPTAVLSWIEGIYFNVSLGLRHYVGWPMQMAGYPLMSFMGQQLSLENDV